MTLRKNYVFSVLLLTCAAIYFQTLGFGYIEIDDPKHIFENPHLLNPTMHGLIRFWSQPFFSLYIPLTYSSWFALAVLSLKPFLFHLANLSLHCANAYLVFLILKRCLQKEKFALLGAILFACHPLQVESVAWISAFKDLLSGFFALIFLNLVLMEKADRKTKALMAGVFLLALLSKPSVALLPVPILLLRHFSLRLSWRKSLVGLSAPLFFSSTILILTKYLQPDSQVQIKVPLWQRPFVAIDAVQFYLSKLIFPFQLALDYGKSPDRIFLSKSLWLSLLVIAGLSILVYRMKRRPLFLFGVLLFLFSLLPVLGFIPFQFQLFSTVADHYVYLAMIGLIMALMDLLSNWKSKYFPLSFGTAIAIYFGLLSFQQAAQWQSNDSLFSHTLSVNPRSFLAHNNWAFSLYHQGKFKQAAEHYARVVQLKPEVPDLHRNYGAALIKAGQISEGLNQFKLAAQLPMGNTTF